MIYNIVVYGVYSLIDFICLTFGLYQPISLDNLTNTTIYIVIFNTFVL